jgi:hypothetical protein
MAQDCSQALQNMIDELQKITPEITSIFIFENDGKIIAKDKITTDQSAQQFITAFNVVREKAHTIGGLETLTMYGNYGEININELNELRLATVSANKGDKKTVDLIVNVLAPSIIRLATQLTNNSMTSSVKTTPKLLPNSKEKASIQYSPAETLIDEPTLESRLEENTTISSYHAEVLIDDEEANAALNLGLGSTPQTFVPNKQSNPIEANDETKEILPIANQLKVTKLKTLMPRANTIRVDKELIVSWDESYGNIQIQEVRIESLKGNTAICKCDAIRDPHSTGKGLIQIPEKIQSSLGVSDGEIVLIRPICKDGK